MIECTPFAPTSPWKAEILTGIDPLHTGDKLLRGISRRIDALFVCVPGNREHRASRLDGRF